MEIFQRIRAILTSPRGEYVSLPALKRDKKYEDAFVLNAKSRLLKIARSDVPKFTRDPSFDVFILLGQLSAANPDIYFEQMHSHRKVSSPDPFIWIAVTPKQFEPSLIN